MLNNWGELIGVNALIEEKKSVGKTGSILRICSPKEILRIHWETTKTSRGGWNWGQLVQARVQWASLGMRTRVTDKYFHFHQIE